MTSATPSRILRSLLRAASYLAAAALTALHAVLLVRRVGDGSITDPVILVKWTASATILLLAWRWFGPAARTLGGRTRARRTPDRRLVFWLLVIVLHAGFPTPGVVTAQTAPGEPPIPVPSLLAALGLLLVFVLASGHSGARRRPGSIDAFVPAARLWALAASRPSAPRPPPSAFRRLLPL